MRAGFVIGRLLDPYDFLHLVAWRLLRLPRQPWREIRIVRKALNRSGVRVFEWGLGASTIWYTRWLARQHPDFHWWGMDHDPLWHTRVARRVDSARVHVACSPFVPSYQPVRSLSENERAYINAPRTIGGTFDVILIDGRFRRRCVAVAMELVSPGGLVVLSDAERKYYHCGLDRYPGRFLEVGHTPGSPDRNSLAWMADVSR